MLKGYVPSPTPIIFMYFDIRKVLSYNALLNFIIGSRGCGKTFATKRFCIDSYLKKGAQFFYVRRYKEELATACDSFFDDLQKAGFFTDHEFSYKSGDKIGKFFMDDEIIGFSCPLSMSGSIKSTSFPDVTNILYDEFLIDTRSGMSRYLRNETRLFLELFDTIQRDRNNVKAFLLGNAMSVSNPFFNYFDIDKPYNKEFQTFKDGLILVDFVDSREHNDFKRKTRFGRLIEGTDYGAYNLDNKMLNDDFSFIEKKPYNAKYFFTIVLDKNMFGAWYVNGNYYISNKHDPSYKMKLALDEVSHDDNTVALSSSTKFFIEDIKRHYIFGKCFFDDVKIKNQMLKYLK